MSGTDRNGSVSGTYATVNLYVGDTVNFNLSNVASNHPVYLRVSNGGSNVTTPTASGQGSTGNGVVSWTPAVAGTYYYWIRHRRVSRRTSDNSTVKLLSAFESNIDAGVSAVANVLSPQLDVDISSYQVKFNASIGIRFNCTYGLFIITFCFLELFVLKL